MSYFGGGGRFLNPGRFQSAASRTSLLSQFLSSHPSPSAQQQVPGQTPFQASAGGGVSDVYNINADPIWQKIQAIDQANVAQAKASAISAERQLAIRFGDATGITADANTRKQAANNPYSTLSQLRNQYSDTTHAHDEQLNKDNLFYSGTRAKTLSDDANGYQQNVYNARGQAMDQMTAIQQALLAAEQGAQANDIQGLQDAYGRGISQSQSSGIDPGAGSSVASSLASGGGTPAAPAFMKPPRPAWQQSAPAAPSVVGPAGFGAPRKAARKPYSAYVGA